MLSLPTLMSRYRRLYQGKWMSNVKCPTQMKAGISQGHSLFIYSTLGAARVQIGSLVRVAYHLLNRFPSRARNPYVLLM